MFDSAACGSNSTCKGCRAHILSLCSGIYNFCAGKFCLALVLLCVYVTVTFFYSRLLMFFVVLVVVECVFMSGYVFSFCFVCWFIDSDSFTVKVKTIVIIVAIIITMTKGLINDTFQCRIIIIIPIAIMMIGRRLRLNNNT